MTDTESKLGQIRKAECSNCGGERNCDVKGHCQTSYSTEDFWGQTDWYLLQCRGCEEIFAQKAVTTSEDVNQYYDPRGEVVTDQEFTYHYWSALIQKAKPEWMGEYGIDGIEDVDLLDAALCEVYGALNANLPILSTIGIRTAFDVASDILKVDQGLTFAEKLDALAAGKHIREVDRERLATAVEAGNASAHCGWKPTATDLAAIRFI